MQMELEVENWRVQGTGYDFYARKNSSKNIIFFLSKNFREKKSGFFLTRFLKNQYEKCSKKIEKSKNIFRFFRTFFILIFQ